MNYSQSKMSCQAGDASNSIIEGYSKVDFNASIVSAVVMFLCLLNWTLPALTNKYVLSCEITLRVIMKLEEDRDFCVEEVEFVA